MDGRGERSLRKAALPAVLVLAAVIVVALSIVPSRKARTTPDEGTGLDAWSCFPAEPETGIVVRAEDVVQLRGAMTQQRGPDNAGVLDASGAPATVTYVWCEDANQPEVEPEEQEGPAAAYGEHAAVFEFQVPISRTYYPWVRVWWQDSCGNSFAVILQSGEQVLGTYVVQDGTLQWWHWLPMAGEDGLNLQQGSYTLIVRNREDGARLSRVLFSTKSYQSYHPETSEG